MADDRLYAKLDVIEQKLDENTRQTIDNTASLREHMRRTELLENRVKPLEEHVVQMRVLVPAIAFLGALIGVFVAIRQLLWL